MGVKTNTVDEVAQEVPSATSSILCEDFGRSRGEIGQFVVVAN